jgi:probable F420-dependent oxidoreductase
MRFTISIPQHVPDGTFDPAALRAYLARAEALGFESAWTGEQVIGSMPHLGPIETMSYAAACTDRIRIGCIAFVSSLHNPLQLAKSMATLDQLSRGRIEIGLATGGRTRMFSAFGVEPDTFVTPFNESLQLMKALWTEPRVTFEGRFWQPHAAAMEPKPFQKPHPPIWFGGSHPNALRRAMRYADGFFRPGSQTTAQFADQVNVVREALSEQKRDPGTFSHRQTGLHRR